MSFRKEHRQILDMLAEGKITPDQAQALMEKLNQGSSSDGGDEGPTADFSEHGHAASRTAVLVKKRVETGSGSALRYFRIVVQSSDGDDVNIRIPLKIVRAGLKLTTVLPDEAKEKIRDSGIDLSTFSELEGEELIEALRDLAIDVDSSDGDRIRIFCE